MKWYTISLKGHWIVGLWHYCIKSRRFFAIWWSKKSYLLNTEYLLCICCMICLYWNFYMPCRYSRLKGWDNYWNNHVPCLCNAPWYLWVLCLKCWASSTQHYFINEIQTAKKHCKISKSVISELILKMEQQK